MNSELQKREKRVIVIPPKEVTEAQNRYRQLRTAAYCRVSTDKYEQELSFDAQVEYYTKKIMENPEWSMAGVFADEGISGTQSKKRKDFMRMIRHCRQGKIDQIITKSVSRFGRNTAECLEYIRELKQLGIAVIFEKEGLNTLYASTELYIALHCVFAQAESESLSGNVKWGMQKAAEKGIVRFQYSTILGYRKGPDGEPEIDPEEAPVIEYIFDRYLIGDTEWMIAEKLTELKIPTPRKKERWSEVTVKSILQNVKYKGDALLCKTTTVDCISKQVVKNTTKPMYYVENNHVPLIPQEKFDQVQLEIARRAALKTECKMSNTAKVKAKERTEDNVIPGAVKTGRQHSGRFALNRKLICGKCKTPYQRVMWYRESGSLPVWRCMSRHQYGQRYCPDSPTVGELELHEAITKAFRVVANDENQEEGVELLKQHIRQFYGETDATDTTAEEKMLSELKTAILERAKEGDADSEDFIRLSGDIAKIKQKIAEKEEKRKSASENELRMRTILDYVDMFKNHPLEYNDQAVRQLVEYVEVLSEVEILIIFKGGIEIKVPLQDYKPRARAMGKKKSGKKAS